MLALLDKLNQVRLLSIQPGFPICAYIHTYVFLIPVNRKGKLIKEISKNSVSLYFRPMCWPITGLKIDQTLIYRCRSSLPCDLAPPSDLPRPYGQNETMYNVYLVLWYKDDQGEPLYRLECFMVSFCDL